MKSLTLALLLACTFPIVPSAQAAAPACATTSEYTKVKRGQSVTKVRKIFGGREGWDYDLGGHRAKSWQKCGGGEKYAQVDFHRGRVIAKRWTS